MADDLARGAELVANGTLDTAVSADLLPALEAA